MIFPIYFSHGYREREIEFNEYFGILFERSGLLPSIDPPSSNVNSSKLEKHLKYTNGLIAVLSRRDNIVSPYILFEIEMCLKLGKPALVFIEDNLPDSIIPLYIMQKRFSTRSFSREVFEHMHSLEIYKKYVGISPIPKYQVASKQKSCLLIGIENLNNELQTQLNELLLDKGFKIIKLEQNIKLPISNSFHFELLNLDLSIIIVNDKNPILNYFFGAINAYQIPNIQITINEDYIFDKSKPIEFQPIYITNKNLENDLIKISEQIDLFEEDFVLLEDKEKIHNYVESLASSFSYKGHYTQDLRTQIIQNINGDNFSNIKNSKIMNKSTKNDIQTDENKSL